jgi:hypothetical protein
MLQVVWFKRDIRIADHTQLAETARNRPVLPLYVAEPELWQQPDGALRRWAFTVECLAELRDDRGKLGQPLIVRAGDIVETLDRLRRQVPGLRLWSHEERDRDGPMNAMSVFGRGLVRTPSIGPSSRNSGSSVDSATVAAGPENGIGGWPETSLGYQTGFQPFRASTWAIFPAATDLGLPPDP